LENTAAKFILIIIAIGLTILIVQLVPKNQFTPYRLELDSTWVKETDVQDYLVDLNNDFKYEIIRHNHINKPGHSLELIYKNRVSVLAVSYEKSFTISKLLRFADVNQDGIREMIFVSVTDNIARLFFMGFDFKTNSDSPVPNYHVVEVDSAGYWDNLPDVINYDILANGSDLYFDLQAGYNVQPRNLYKYNFQTKKLIKTKPGSIVNKELEFIRHHGQDYLLAKKVVATANTVKREHAEKCRTSKNADSVKAYELVKNLNYEYGDFSSYILLYNENLNFAFTPVEFFGKTNYTLSGLLWDDTTPRIISLTNNQLNDTTQRKITLCNLNGDIVKQLPATENYDHLYADKNTFALYCNENLDVYSSGLKMENRVAGLTFASGFYDLGPDSGHEFIAFENNEIIVFSENFHRKTSFTIAQEFAPYPVNNRIDILQKEGKTCFLFNSRLFYYLFSYEKNELAILKYPFYLVIFLFWTGLLLLLLKVNSNRLVKEKQQLEKIVSQRTAELELKNRELAIKNDRIQIQADEITDQYQRLEKLDFFKETLTHTLVHDLKDPLNQILHNNTNDSVSYPARKMLRLITNMLDVEKYEHTEFKLSKAPHSLRNILAEVINGQEISLREKNLTLRLHFTDYEIMADKEVMIRVFDNLISNAIRYSPLNRNIEIFAVQSGDDAIQIIVRNYGEPIPEEALPYIFDKYRHFGKNERCPYRSTGLGLTFCKMAVEAHGGKISVWYKPEEGCNFWFTVPFKSKTGETEEKTISLQEHHSKILFSEADFKVMKAVVKQIKEFEIFEISRFHEILDPLKETSGKAVNDWITLVFRAINIQNIDEFKSLTDLAENEQTENSDC
jgi:signal transduction histidine kinase